MKSSGLKIIQSEIMNKNCAKSWDLGLGIIKEKALWRLAAENGAMLVDFLKTFRAMKTGSSRGISSTGLLLPKGHNEIMAPTAWSVTQRGYGRLACAGFRVTVQVWISNASADCDPDRL